MEKVVVGISGGVDSAVVCHLLKEWGYEVVSVFLKLHDDGDENAAFEVAKSLGIDFFVVDKREEFKKEVIDYFVSTYMAGKTPNPCVQCNKRVKVRYLIEFADSIGCSKIATGHYARISRDENGIFSLRRGADQKKDQSYFLWQLGQAELSRLMFPLGDIQKKDVKLLASSLGMKCAELKESSEVCFVKDDYASYILDNAKSENTKKPFEKGNFVDKNGKILGEHKGYINYTVGQRRGLNVSLGARAYVTRIDADSKEVTLAGECDVFTDLIYAESVSFLNNGFVLDESLYYDVKVRYRAPSVKASVKLVDGLLVVHLMEKVKIPAPAQSLVFYSGDEVVFGAIVR